MELDNTTYNDLSIFHHEEEFSVFNKLNFTQTSEGREWLMRFFKNPFSDLNKIVDTQKIVHIIKENMSEWPTSISNGTLMVIAKFYESSIDTMPGQANTLNGVQYRVFHTADFSLVRYTLTHFADFLRGMNKLAELFTKEGIPHLLSSYLQHATDLMRHSVVQQMIARDPAKKFSVQEVVGYGKYLKEDFRWQTFELINIFGRLDAWRSMALAGIEYKLSFPEFIESNQPVIDTTGLYHILLPKPVPYDVHMNKDGNFLFLTGANMAGKSTFIRAVGTAVFLAHLGMGIPAEKMKLTIFDGLLSNINVVDNIVKGESYFFNEVQRIRNTIIKIDDGRKWLVLIDELFKGTNVQDAMKCSSTVIKGLLKIRSSLFILSTHLYEIGEELKEYSNIAFQYFETSVKDDQLYFSYQLKEGISNDRLGYLILKREKVVELLEKL
jgi:DNA mismatch repair protein MutS